MRASRSTLWRASTRAEKLTEGRRSLVSTLTTVTAGMGAGPAACWLEPSSQPAIRPAKRSITPSPALRAEIVIPPSVENPSMASIRQAVGEGKHAIVKARPRLCENGIGPSGKKGGAGAARVGVLIHYGPAAAALSSPREPTGLRPLSERLRGQSPVMSRLALRRGGRNPLHPTRDHSHKQDPGWGVVGHRASDRSNVTRNFMPSSSR